jgi:hypothetical protein
MALAIAGSPNPAAANETMTYSYDALGRLIKVARAGTVNNNASECYAYDPASNRSNVTVSSTASCNAPSFSINDASGTEGGAVTFTVTRSGPTTGSYTVNYATANNTATAADYTSKSGTLTFADGVTTQSIQVTTLQDTLVEGNETFYVNLSAASGGAAISNAQGTGTIIDDDSAGVSFSIDDAQVTEGGDLVFTVHKIGGTSVTKTVDYGVIAGGSATASSDYAASGTCLLSGTLSFAYNVSTLTFCIHTINDTAVEPSETVLLGLSNPSTGTTISDGQATGTIVDNDSGGGTNHPPITQNDIASVQTCGDVIVDVVANDSDPDGDPLSLTAVTPQAFSIYSPTEIEYLSGPNPGTKTATYTVQDSHGATATGTLTITVTSGGNCTLSPVQAPTEPVATDPGTTTSGSADTPQ